MTRIGLENIAAWSLLTANQKIGSPMRTYGVTGREVRCPINEHNGYLWSFDPRREVFPSKEIDFKFYAGWGSVLNVVNKT